MPSQTAQGGQPLLRGAGKAGANRMHPLISIPLFYIKECVPQKNKHECANIHPREAILVPVTVQD